MSIVPPRKGFACPSCGGFIPTSLHHLIVYGRTACPSCALVLTLHDGDRQHLRGVETELQTLESDK